MNIETIKFIYKCIVYWNNPRLFVYDKLLTYNNMKFVLTVSKSIYRKIHTKNLVIKENYF